jgi:ectoine hydroxylase-related dioxygenase (phytanoyl-CoA dioxygenase family)
MLDTTLQYRLDDRQVRQFDEEGYLVVENLFTNQELQPVIDEISADLDNRCKEAVAAGRLSRTYEEYDFEHRLAHVNAEDVTISKSMWDTKLVLPSFFNLMTNPKLLDVAEQFCGPEIIASSVYRLRPKVPSHSWSPVPWHQDSAYFEAYCDLGLVMTVWVPLVDATEERGCLWVMPRAHKGGLFFHKPDDMAHYLVIPDDEFGGRKAIAAPVPKGGVLLLTNRTPHASFENKTDIVRWSMDLRYQSAALPTNANITRLPGEAKSVGTVGVPLACNPPEPDFLVRSKIRPNEVMKTPEQFLELRKNHVYQAATDRWGYSVAKRKDPMGNPYKIPDPKSN